MIVASPEHVKLALYSAFLAMLQRGKGLWRYKLEL